MSRSSVPGQLVSFRGAVERTMPAQGVVAEMLESRQLLAAAVVGTVFEDLNKNGAQDAGEAGIPNVEITLTGHLRGGAAVKLTTTTDRKGRFRFKDLAPGKYTVSEQQPAGYKDGKDRSSVRKSAIGNDVISQLKLGKKGKCRVTFGERIKPTKPVTPPPPRGSISGHVYEDANDDGVKDNGESGIAGARLSLTGETAAGKPVNRTAITHANGFYQFKGLKAGTYAVVETQPNEYVDGIDAVGSLGGVVEDDELSAILLAAGEDGADYNFGELRPGSISGKVFIDDDGDGVMDEGELAVPDVLITLTGTSDIGESVTVSARTNEQGAYEFTDLRPGTYDVVETQPFGLEDDQSIVGSAGGVATVNAFSNIQIAAGDDATAYDFTERFHPDELAPTDDGGDGHSDGACDDEWDLSGKSKFPRLRGLLMHLKSLYGK